MNKKILFPDQIVIKTELFTIAQDWEVPIPWFFILSPLRKIKSISEFTDNEIQEYWFLIRKLREGMKDILNIKDVYFFQNEDTEHGYHLWVFPRHEWMEKFWRKIQSVRPIMEYAEEYMCNDENCNAVREHVRNMKNYML